MLNSWAIVQAFWVVFPKMTGGFRFFCSVQMTDQTRTGLLMEIRGIDNLTPAELEACLADGFRFVFYEYCISLVIVSLRRPTAVYLLRPGEIGLLRGLPYVLVSLLLGWWGIPWGLIYTPLTILTNLSGGRDVTDELRTALLGQAPVPAE